jgi:hypothetical protein
MANVPRSRTPSRHWLWLLVIPWIAMVWVPSYNQDQPRLWGFPFFYWYQLLWVVISAVVTGFVYFKTRRLPPNGDAGPP